MVCPEIFLPTILGKEISINEPKCSSVGNDFPLRPFGWAKRQVHTRPPPPAVIPKFRTCEYNQCI